MNDTMNDVFKKWEKRGSSGFNSRGRRSQNKGFNKSNNTRSGEYFNSYSGTSRPRDRRFKHRDPFFKLPKYDGLAQFKMAPCVMAVNKQRPFVGSCCAKCLPFSRAMISDSRVFSLSICNVLHIPLFRSLDFSMVLNILKKREKPMYPDVCTDVLKNDRVLSAIEKTVKEDLQDCDDVHHENLFNSKKIEQFNRAKNILECMKSSVSSIFLKVSSVFLHSVLCKMFDGVLVHKGQIEILQTSSQENVPILYLPLYQSNFDSILISFILFMNSLKVPLVATDQNLYIPIFKCILKFLGAFYIRNYLKKDHSDFDILYTSVLQSYIIESLKAGHNLEFLINEKFSLQSKHDFNKCNLLSIAVESVLNGSLEDIYVSTVSVSHEKFLGRDFIDEQLGQPKEKESSFSFLYSWWKNTHGKLGSVRLNFGQPFSIKEFLQSSKNKLSICMPSIETPPSSPIKDEFTSIEQEIENEHLLLATKNLVQHIVYDATFSTSLMSTHLLAFLLLTQYRKGATQQQLQNRMDWLRGELTNKKRDSGFTGESLPVIKRAVELLGKDLVLIEIIDMEWTSSDLENNNMKVVIYKPSTKLPHVFELRCYARCVVPAFLLDSIVVNALYAIVDVEICHFRHCDSLLFVSRNQLIDKAIELCDILQFEFVPIQPCSDIAICFSDTIDELIEKECLHASDGKTSLSNTRYHRSALSFGGSGDESDLADDAIMNQSKLKIDLTEESISHLEFLRNVLSSYIESYWISACTLLKLIDEVKEESVFIQDMQLTAQEKLYKGLLAYEESFSALTFKNSLKLFESWDVIESYVQDGIKLVYLNENYNKKENINDVIAKVEAFRK